MKKISMKKYLFMAVFSMAMPIGMMAQEPEAATNGEEMTVSLKDAISNALQYSKQLQSSKMDMDLYHQKIRETRASMLPQLSASVAYQTYFGKDLDLMGMKRKMEDQVSLGATASWTLAMQAVTGVKISKIAQQIAEQQIAQTELDIKANVADTYYGILVCQRNIDILKANLVDLEDIKKHTENMFAVGACEQTDVDQIVITVATLKNAILSTERTCETTKRMLLLQMGLPIDTKFSTTQKLDDLIAESTVATMDSSKFDITNNLNYKLLELSNQVNEKTLSLKRQAHLPALNLTYQYSKMLKGGFMNFDHVGVATVSIPIFSGLSRNAQVKQAKIEIERGKTNMALLQDNLNISDEQCRFELNSAIESYLLQLENLEVAKRVLENYKNKYNNGVMSSLDLTQANTNYLQAETSFATACLDLLMAHTKLSKLYNNFEF